MTAQLPRAALMALGAVNALCSSGLTGERCRNTNAGRFPFVGGVVDIQKPYNQLLESIKSDRQGQDRSVLDSPPHGCERGRYACKMRS
jgi:hypothetical protein